MFRNIKRFIKNVWLFRSELWEYRNFDSGYSLMMLRKSLEILKEKLKFGLEIESSRYLKIQKINRAIKILKWHEYDVAFIHMAEQKLAIDMDLISKPPMTLTTKEKAIHRLADKYEQDTWQELMQILEGQGLVDYHEHDGTNLKTWWD